MVTARGSAAGSRDKHVQAVDDLPAYTLRVSPRAKYVRLNVTPHEGLVVVVPSGAARGFDPTPILRSKSEWIEECLAHIADVRQAYTGDPVALLPTEIVFTATGERWRVEYRPTASPRASVRTAPGTVTISGGTTDADACLAALNRWLQSRAKERLLPLLALHAEKTGLSYRKASVRGQRSRWGGCSSSGSITLNRCLLFLAPELVDSVVLHELAHLRQPNHSSAFWRELQQIDPAAHEHRRAIRDAWSTVPTWAEPWVIRRR